jgi:hypothetical protein
MPGWDSFASGETHQQPRVNNEPVKVKQRTCQSGHGQPGGSQPRNYILGMLGNSALVRIWRLLPGAAAQG